MFYKWILLAWFSLIVISTVPVEREATALGPSDYSAVGGKAERRPLLGIVGPGGTERGQDWRSPRDRLEWAYLARLSLGGDLRDRQVVGLGPNIVAAVLGTVGFGIAGKGFGIAGRVRCIVAKPAVEWKVSAVRCCSRQGLAVEMQNCSLYYVCCYYL